MGRVGRLGPVAALIRPAFGFGSPKIPRSGFVPKIEIRSGTGQIRHWLADRIFPAQSDGKPISNAAIPAWVAQRLRQVFYRRLAEPAGHGLAALDAGDPIFGGGV
jgi:hypothetical protein